MDEITRLLGGVGSAIPIALLWNSKKNLLLSDWARNPDGEWEGAGIKDPSGMWVSGDKEGTARLSTLGASTLATNAAGTIANALAGRKSTTVGNVFNAVGDIAGFIPGPYGALVSGALKTVGGGINALYGSYIDEAFVRETNQNIASTLGQSFSANNSADFMSNALNRKQIGSVSTSLVGEGPKARRVAADLNKGIELANKTSVTNLSLSGNQVNRTLAMESLEKLSAFGGPLGAALANRFALGGVSQLFGGNFSNGLKYIDAGLTHEENPYNGVLLGVDSLGTPNLVEEGERIFDDYVFSKRLIVPKKLKGIYKEGGNLKRGEERLSYDLKVLNKFSGLSYADAAEKAEKLSGAKERPNDPIAKRGLLALLAVLAESQEKERYEEALKDMLKLIENMSPEEYAQMQEEMALLEYMAEQLAAAELQAMQQLAMQELLMAQMSPEEQQAYLLLMMLQLMQGEGMAQQLPLMSPEEIEALQRAQQGMAAYGGRLFATGGPFDGGEDGSSSPFEAFLKNLNIEDLRIYFNLPPKKQQRIYRLFASQYLKDKDAAVNNRDDLDSKFSEFATNKLNEITKKNNRTNWLKGNVVADDFKDIDENTLKALAKTYGITGESKEDIVKNIVEQKLTREGFNKKYSTLPEIATPEEWTKDAAGNYIWPNSSSQQVYDWGTRDNYLVGGFGAQKGNTEGRYRPGKFPEEIGGVKYGSISDYELSDPYLKATWELMLDARNLHENPDGDYSKSPLTLYNSHLNPNYTWNSNGVGKDAYELMIPENLQESFNTLDGYDAFKKWITENKDALKKHGNRRFDGEWGERHFIPSSKDGLPTMYYYMKGNTEVPVIFNPDTNNTSYLISGALEPGATKSGYKANWQLLEPSLQSTLTLSPTEDILNKGISTQTSAAGAIGAGGTPFPKPNNVMPLFGLGLGLAGAGVSLNDALNPDYSDFDAAANYAKGMGRFMPISFIPAGERFEYTPMDIDYINSVSRNANNAGLSYLRNAANGNIGAGMAGYLGLMQNYLKGVGENYVKVDELNSKNQYLATAGNLERSKFNSLGHLDAAKANQDAYLKATSGAGDLLAKLAIGKQSVKDAAYKRFGDNLSAALSMANTYLTNRDNNRLLGWYMQNGQADDLNDIQKSNYVKNKNNNLYWWQRR